MLTRKKAVNSENSLIQQSKEQVVRRKHVVVKVPHSASKMPRDFIAAPASKMKITNKSWSNSILKSLAHFYKNRILCDTQVQTASGRLVLAHSCVLASASPQLQEILVQNSSFLDLGAYDDVLSDLILEFIYNGTIIVESSMILDIQTAAGELGISGLLDGDCEVINPIPQPPSTASATCSSLEEEQKGKKRKYVKDLDSGAQIQNGSMVYRATDTEGAKTYHTLQPVNRDISNIVDTNSISRVPIVVGPLIHPPESHVGPSFHSGNEITTSSVNTYPNQSDLRGVNKSDFSSLKDKKEVLIALDEKSESMTDKSELTRSTWNEDSETDEDKQIEVQTIVIKPIDEEATEIKSEVIDENISTESLAPSKQQKIVDNLLTDSQNKTGEITSEKPTRRWRPRTEAANYPAPPLKLVEFGIKEAREIRKYVTKIEGNYDDMDEPDINFTAIDVATNERILDVLDKFVVTREFIFEEASFPDTIVVSGRVGNHREAYKEKLDCKIELHTIRGGKKAGQTVYRCVRCKNRMFVTKKFADEHLKKGPVKKFVKRQMIADASMLHKITSPKMSGTLYRCRNCHKVFTDEKSAHTHLFRKDICYPCDHNQPGYIYRCRSCEQMFVSLGKYDNHVRRSKECRKKNDLTYECGVCNKIFTTEKAILRHLNKVNHCSPPKIVPDVHKSNKKEFYECDVCHTQFENEAVFRNHKANPILCILPPDDDFLIPTHTCLLCARTTSSAESLQKHAAYQHPQNISGSLGPYMHGLSVCQICHEEVEDYAEHIWVVHNRKTSKDHNYYQCAQCSYRTTNDQEHAQHEESIHGVKITSNTCKFCKKLFLRSQDLTDHINSEHFGIAPYKCTYCPQSFSVRQNLEDHLPLHTNLFPFQCRLCEEKFTSVHKIDRHIILIHKINAENSHAFRVYTNHSQNAIVDVSAQNTNVFDDLGSYRCEICGDVFQSEFQVYDHVVKEHGEDAVRRPNVIMFFPADDGAVEDDTGEGDGYDERAEMHMSDSFESYQDMNSTVDVCSDDGINSSLKFDDGDNNNPQNVNMNVVEVNTTSDVDPAIVKELAVAIETEVENAAVNKLS